MTRLSSPDPVRETGTALVLIDFVNSLDFPGGDALFRRALPAARAAGALQMRARQSSVPSIFVNDLFETGATGLRDLVAYHREQGGRGGAMVEALAVDPDRDHFVAKPMYSAFFRTDLDALLRRQRVAHLILTGVAADICVLASAFDARMRGFDLSVPCDCVAAESADAELWALRHMARVLGADLQPSPAYSLSAFGPAA